MSSEAGCSGWFFAPFVTLDCLPGQKVRMIEAGLKRPVVWQVHSTLFQIETLALKEQCSGAVVVQMIKKHKINPQW